ncbi:PLP-dependent aminotransferase family protein [Kutzneria buriramensis]|uniref:2-aminoadipate transaminase n=1 Tax=Kutzneria buriramensis TaxID=1045776 RepID=A0A3E0HFD1_9PSEU|nr:PLP-dependent aminotransferase family protein [Kutzneria buriramensis]REH43873.1 2-aminoadipate transaminase [Kutzneria buriramensis]
MIDWNARLSRRAHGQPDLIGGILALAGARDLINFSGGFPDPSLFATDVLGDIARKLIESDAAVALQYSSSEGIASTRAALADLLAGTDGRRPGDDELTVTSGGIDAITLIAKSMLDPGDVVVVEEPSYLGAVSGFVAFDPELRGVPLDDDGLDVDALAALLRTLPSPPKLLYTIPDFQNPSGRTMSAERRGALVELCRRHGILIVEDVAYSQLGFDDAPRPTLWSLGPDVVVQIGTFSKVFLPGVRLGWAVGPAAVIAQLRIAKQNSDQCAGALGQRMLEEYLRAGHLDAHLPRARDLYRRRAATLTDALERHFDGLATWTVPRGGFFSWLRVPGVDTVALAAAARESKVAFVPGAGFFAERRDDEHLRLSYSRISESDIEEGVARLAVAVRAMRERRAS